MALPDTALRDAARRAYEAGRLRRATIVGSPAFVIAGASAPLATDLAWHAAVGLALVFAAIGLAWRGGPAGRAVGPALVAGIAPLVLPLVTMRVLCATGSCDASCLAACLAGGAIAGAWVGVRASRASGSVEFVAAGAVIAGLAGSLGCAFVGAAGVVGMLAAFAVVAAPLTLAHAARA